MIRFILMAFLITLLACEGAFSQSKNIIRGRVIDAETKEPIIGATIAELNSQNRAVNGTITDVKGEFLFKITNPADSLSFSFIGYERQVTGINNRTDFTILLQTTQTAIEEVTVTAKSRDPLTGIADEDNASATSKITFSDIQITGSASPGDALQGAVTGLDVISASGDPGSGSQLVIRGLSTLGNAFPLIVVDGIPRTVQGTNFDFTTATQEDLGNLINVAPQDIKSIKVLKDAASTAAWGSQGANGVLLIETNRGTKGKITYNYNYQTSLNVQPEAIPMLNGDEYVTMQLEELHNALGNFNLPKELAYDPHYSNFNNYNKNTDWINAITRNGLNQEHYLGASGGGQNTLFFTSFRYLNQIGTTLNTSYNQLSTRVNLNYTLSHKIRFTINFTYNNSLKKDNKTPNDGMNVRKMAYIKAPNSSIWEYDQNGKLTGEYFTPIRDYQGLGSFYFNPVAIVNLSQNNLSQNELDNDFKLTYKIVPWCNFDQTISFQYANNKTNQFLPSSALGTDWLNPVNNLSYNSLGQSNSLLSRSQMFFNIFQNNPTHSLSSNLLFEVHQSTSDSKQLQTNRTASTAISDPASASPISAIRSSSIEKKDLGVLGGIIYKFKDRYIVIANMRADASSVLGPGKRWTLFPSIEFAWRMANEPWLKDIPWIEEIKPRIDWGKTGNLKTNYGPYARFGLYNTNGQYINNTAIGQQQINLLNYSMEISSSWDAGFDMILIHDRMNISADIYNNITSDLTWTNYLIPLSSGFDHLAYFNGGKLQNRGWEFSVDWIFLKKSNLDVGIKCNFSHNENEFLAFPDNFNPVKETSIGNEEYPREASIGRPVGSFFGFKYLGVWPSDNSVVVTDKNGNVLKDENGKNIPFTYKESYTFKGGDAHYADINHDGNIDLNDVVYLGNSNPLFQGGFGLNARYKNFRMLSFFNYRVGFDIVNQVAMDTQGMSNTDNQSLAVLRRWRYQGQDEPGMLPRAYLNNPSNNLGSDRYVEPGDFLRLNNLSIQYKMNRKLTHILHVKSANMTLTMRKIFTFTNYSGQDPEIGIGSDPFFMGVDNARTPVPKIYTLSFIINI